MAVSIRLRREGSKNRLYYKVVAADKRSPRDGKFLEILGTYDPKVKGHNSTLKLDRVEHWISVGAQPSDTVRSLIKKTKAHQAATPVTRVGGSGLVGERRARPSSGGNAEGSRAAESKGPLKSWGNGLCAVYFLTSPSSPPRLRRHHRAEMIL